MVVAKERAITRWVLTPTAVPGEVTAGWARADGSLGFATVRFHRQGKNWEIDSVLVRRPTAAKLRDVPLAKIMAAANADPEIRAWIEQTPPEDPRSVEIKKQLIRRRKRPRLERPALRRPLPDAFFEQVAACYREAVAAGLPPAKTLAEDADTPQGTVNRWIAEARERGHLPPGEPGKVTT
jgi:hypothetical protein